MTSYGCIGKAGWKLSAKLAVINFFFALHNYTNAIKSMVLSVFISLTYTDIANVSLITYKDKTFQSLIKPKLSVLCENITASRKALKQVK